MFRSIALILLTAAAASAQHSFDNGLMVRFRNGGAARVHTESTVPNSALATDRVVAVAEGMLSHRRVIGSSGKVLFAYDLSLTPTSPGVFTLRAQPANPELGRTLAASREFTGVRLNQAVRLEVFVDSSSGERLFDIIMPVEPADAAPDAAPRRIPPEDEISLQAAQVFLGGSLLREFRNTWLIGPAIKLGLTGRGLIYLSRKPVSGYDFTAAGKVDGRKLTFAIGNDAVEVVSRSNILKTSETGTVWIYHDPRASSTGVSLEVGTWEELLPKR